MTVCQKRVPLPVPPPDLSRRPIQGDESLEVSPLARSAPIRILRLAQVIEATGLRKTKIYELQAAGDFPMRVQIAAHSVGWVEEEVQAWLTRRVADRVRPLQHPATSRPLR